MIPGPMIIRKCSSCASPFSQDTFESGNTLGARSWTDGKADAPMLPDQPWLVKCPNCGALVWTDEQKQVGRVYPCARKRPRLINAWPCETPSADDYFALLETKVSDPKKERYLRLSAWWAGNDQRRENQEKQPLSEREAGNLRAFIGLLDEADATDRLMKAEAFRELGQFAEAVRLLSQPFEERLSQAVKVIRELTARKCPFLTEIRSE